MWFLVQTLIDSICMQREAFHNKITSSSSYFKISFRLHLNWCWLSRDDHAMRIHWTSFMNIYFCMIACVFAPSLFLSFSLTPCIQLHNSHSFQFIFLCSNVYIMLIYIYRAWINPDICITWIIIFFELNLDCDS